ncbi:MAG: hypothetical protein PHX78_03735 [bacterium]|nr:hypothetical protein [bacterium]
MVTNPELDNSKSVYHEHWHVFIIHFPISFFVAAFGFQIMHLFTRPECFEEATNVSLIAGTIVMIPAIWSGWHTWKKSYKGAHVPIFQRKIIIAFIMLGLSFGLTIWRVFFIEVFVHSLISPEHWVYLIGNTLLMMGASVEGYYGGRLNHR